MRKRLISGEDTVYEVVLLREKARKLCVRWTRGTRKGSDRPAHTHPGDVVKILDELPGARSNNEREWLAAVAWLHDVIEDGISETGSQITSAALIAEGIPTDIAEAVETLSKTDAETKEHYLRRLARCHTKIRMIKCADRLANLRELRTTHGTDNSWWRKYASETERLIVPLLDELPETEQRWLRRELKEVMKA